jgi:hypothetical protein
VEWQALLSGGSDPTVVDGWHVTEGWQGTPDEIFVDGDGTLLATKTWWVAPDHLGRGPFRWVVYATRGGAPLATSQPFYLPDAAGQTLTVQLALQP